MADDLRLAVLLPSEYTYYRRAAVGFTAWCREHGVGIAFGDPALSPLDLLRGMGVAGVVTQASSEQRASEFAACGLPVINISALTQIRAIPSVLTDNRAVGRLAAEHLLDLGLRSFACVGIDGHFYSRERQAGFSETVSARGYPCRHLAPAGFTHREYAERLPAWLAALPKPVGVLAGNDQRARGLVEFVRQAGIAIPEQLALVGVDDDEFFCGTSPVPLSSVDPDALTLGRTAAALLAGMARGAPAPTATVLVPPRAVVARQSSDVLAVADPQLAIALRFLRTHACERIQIGDVLARVPMSRRSLERAVRDAIGRSPAQEILRLRLEHARWLLRESTQSVGAIARACGFGTARQFVVTFHRKVGEPPGAFRRRITGRGEVAPRRTVPVTVTVPNHRRA